MLFWRGVWLCLLLPLGWPAALASGSDLSLRLAWQGHLKSGFAHSELKVRFLAPRSGQARITVHGSSLRVSRDFPIRPAQLVTFSLPVVHEHTQPLLVDLHVDGELLVQRRLEPVLLPATARLVAIVPDPDISKGVFSAENVTLLHVTPRELPEHGPAYGQLSALVVPGTVLQVLSRGQLEALGEYLGACGTLYLSQPAAAAEAALRALAGCSGSRVFAALPASSDDLAPRPASALPGAATLRTLFAGDHYGAVQALVLFLLGYLGLLLLAARSATQVLPLLALPIAATVTALLAWSLSNPFVHVAAWAEMDSGDSTLRYAGLLQVNGTSRRQVSLNLPRLLGVPHVVQPSGTVDLHYDSATKLSRLSMDSRLLSRHEFIFSGAAPGVQIEVFGDRDSVSVINRGVTDSPPGLVAWHGQRFSLPALAAGQAWQRPAQAVAESWGDAAPEQLLRQKAIGGGTWLLMPVDIAALRPWLDASSVANWLLVKGAGDA